MAGPGVELGPAAEGSSGQGTPRLWLMACIAVGRRNTEGGYFPIADAVGHLESKIRLAYDILREASAIGLQAAMNHTANSIPDFEVAGVVLAALGDNAGVVTPDDGLRWGQ